MPHCCGTIVVKLSGIGAFRNLKYFDRFSGSGGNPVEPDGHSLCKLGVTQRITHLARYCKWYAHEYN